MSQTPPAPPDYTAAANSQAAASKDITNTQNFANRPNINTPFGTQSWQTNAATDPATGQRVTSWTQNNTLTPAAQQALTDQQNITAKKSNIARGLMGSAANQLKTPIDYNSATALQTGPNATGQVSGPQASGPLDSSGAFFNKAGDAVMSQFNRYQAPLLNQQKSDQIAQLNAQGLKPGDAAYDRAMQNMENNQQQTRQNAQDNAVGMSAQVGNEMFGQDMANNQNQFNQGNQAAQFRSNQNSQQFGQQQSSTAQNNQVHQQQIADMMQRQGFSLNEVNAILSGQQVAMPNMPNFSQANASQTPQLLQAANDQYGANMQQFGANQAGTQGLLSGATSIAGMFSDRRLKRNIRRIGSLNGISFYTYRYVWGELGVGVMADEVRHIPGAVHRHSSGYDMVNYGALHG